MTAMLRVVSVVVAAVSSAAIVGTGFTEAQSLSWLATAWPIPYVVVGFLLTYRRPQLVTGWLFAAIAFLVSTGAIGEVLSETGLARGGAPPWWAVLSAWYGEWYWLPLIYTTLILLPLLFPDGSPPSPRFRWVTAFIVTSLGVFTVLAALQGTLDTPGGRRVSNPIGIANLGDVEEGGLAPILIALSMIFLVAAFSGLVLRYRRSRGAERQQLKLFTFAGLTMIVGFVVAGVIDGLLGHRYEIIDLVGFALPPIAAAFAIFRYRLYAIDRFISRTVTYALVTALVVGVYIAAVAVMSAALDPLGGQSPLAVAVATLAAAGVFRPARRRIQDVVDRRFNRARYDAERTLEGFRERVRSDVDLDRLCADLLTVTDETFEPRTAVVWLRADEAAA